MPSLLLGLFFILFVVQDADSAFPIVFRRPDGCERADCSVYWAMGPNTDNSDCLDVYMEGDVTGWMALGFSENQQMVYSY